MHMGVIADDKDIRQRIEETKYFINKLKEIQSIAQDDTTNNAEFRYNLHAFLCSSRSIIYLLDKKITERFGKNSPLLSQRKEIFDRDIMNIYIWRLRNTAVHKKQINSNTYVRKFLKNTGKGCETGCCIIWMFDDLSNNRELLKEIQKTYNFDVKTLNNLIRGKDVISHCEYYITNIKSMIEELSQSEFDI